MEYSLGSSGQEEAGETLETAAQLPAAMRRKLAAAATAASSGPGGEGNDKWSVSAKPQTAANPSSGTGEGGGATEAGPEHWTVGKAALGLPWPPAHPLWMANTTFGLCCSREIQKLERIQVGATNMIKEGENGARGAR